VNTAFRTDTCDCIAQVAPASDCQVCALTSAREERDDALDKLSKLRSATKAFLRGLQKAALEADLMMCDQARQGAIEGCSIMATKHSGDYGVVLCDDCEEYIAEELTSGNGKDMPPLEDFPHADQMRKLRDLLRKS
jgi:hypothetical protein